MPYTKQVWTDEAPTTTPIKYKISESSSGDITPSAEIEIVTPVTAGSPVNASRLNYMEEGIETAQETAEASVPKSLATAIGQLLYSTASGVWASLLKPSVDSLLKMTGAGVPSWKALSEFWFLTKRQGGDTSNWGVPGTTNYTPANVNVQVGRIQLSFTAESSKSVTVTYPTAYASAPHVLVSPPTNHRNSLPLRWQLAESTNQFILQVFVDGGAITGTIDFIWVAIGV